MANHEDLVRKLKALSNENRLAIFEYLRAQERERDDAAALDCCSVGDIADQFELALSTISHHIKELYRAGLIHCDRQGQNVICTVNEQAVEDLKGFFEMPAEKGS